MIQVSAAFDSGNIEVLSTEDPADIRLAIRPLLNDLQEPGKAPRAAASAGHDLLGIPQCGSAGFEGPAGLR